MTTAALGAEVLEECMREQGAAEGNHAGLGRRFQKKLAKANAASWLLATGEDFRVRGVEGGKATFAPRLTHRYMDRVLALSLRDIHVRRTFLEVFHMLKPPTALFGPSIVAKVLRESTQRNQSGRADVSYPGRRNASARPPGCAQPRSEQETLVTALADSHLAVFPGPGRKLH